MDKGSTTYYSVIKKECGLVSFETICESEIYQKQNKPDADVCYMISKYVQWAYVDHTERELNSAYKREPPRHEKVGRGEDGQEVQIYSVFCGMVKEKQLVIMLMWYAKIARKERCKCFYHKAMPNGPMTII